MDLAAIRRLLAEPEPGTNSARQFGNVHRKTPRLRPRPSPSTPRSWASALFAVLVVMLAQPSPARADLGIEIAALEKKGEAIRYSKPAKGSIDMGGASILVDAPIDKVRRMVESYGRYKKYVPMFDQSRLIQKQRGASDVYLEVPVMHGAATIWMVARFAPSKKSGEEEHIVGRFVKGNIDQFVARWRLRSIDAERTLVKLELLVDPGLPLPDAYVTKSLAYAADKGVTAVRDYAEGRKKLPKNKTKKSLARKPKAKTHAKNTAKNSTR